MEDTHYPAKEPNTIEANSILWDNKISELNHETFMNLLSQFEDKWSIKAWNNGKEPFQLGYRNWFDEDDINEETGQPKKFNYSDVEGEYRRIKDKLSLMFNRADTLGILNFEENDDDDLISLRLSRLIDQVDDCWTIIYRAARMYERVHHPSWLPANIPSEPSILRCSTPDFENLNVFQKALLAILRELYENNIKRYKGYCCVQIKTPEGHNTRAWRQTELIKAYVHRMAPKESRFELWQDLTNNGTTIINQVIKHLGDCYDLQFPEIVKDRHVWSFRNGIFIGKEWSRTQEKYVSVFYPYESKEAINLDPKIVSCKYFDTIFEDYNNICKDWFEIPTPNFDKVLHSQEFEPDVCKWMYIMGGRLCFELNDLDKWQIIPFLKGIARSGKSTLITKVFSKFYETDDVRTLSNNVERKFGLSSIHDALLFIAPEIKGDLQLEQAEFQSIVSGEDVSIAVKCEKAKNITWIVPGILGGNEVPNWKDNSGSILRRLMTWHFKKQIRDADTDPLLEIKLKNEIPIIIQKCVRGYLEYSQKYNCEDIWNIIPDYFAQIRKQVATVTNPLEHFLQSDIILFDGHGETYFCPLEVFKKRFFNYCFKNNLGRPRFNPDFYLGPFSSRGVEIKRNNEKTYAGKTYKNQDFIIGVDVIIEEMEE